MPEVNRVSVRVIPNTKGFRETLQKFLKKIEATTRLTLNVEADTGKADHDIKEVSQDRTATVNADADTGKASADLAILTRPRKIEIDVELNSLSLAKVKGQLLGLLGVRGVAENLDKLNTVFQNLDRSVPRLAGLSLIFGNIASAAISAIGGLTTMATSLASLLALAGPLPGLMAGAAVGVGALVVAFQSAGKELKSLTPKWKELRNVIQSNFWDKAKEPILDLVDNLFPQMKDGLKGVSSALGRWAASVAKSFQDAFSDGVLADMMSALSDSIDNATKGTDAFAQSIATLGKFGAQYLPKVGQWFTDMSVKFNGWIQKVTSDGTLKGWVSDAMDALKQLGKVAKSVIGIVGGISKAAKKAGSDGLTTFADGLQKVSKIINGRTFQTALTTIFEGASKALDGLERAFKPIGRLLSSSAPTISRALENLGKATGDFFGAIADALNDRTVRDGLTDFVNGLKKGLDRLTPALKPLGKLLGTAAGFAGDLAKTMGGSLGTALTDLAPAAGKLLDNLKPLLGPVKDLIQGLSRVAGIGLDEVSSQIGDIAKNIAPVVKGFADFLKTLDPQKIRNLADALVAVAGAIVVLKGAQGIVSLIGSLKDLRTNFQKSGKAAKAFKGAMAGIFGAAIGNSVGENIGKDAASQLGGDSPVWTKLGGSIGKSLGGQAVGAMTGAMVGGLPGALFGAIAGAVLSINWGGIWNDAFNPDAQGTAAFLDAINNGPLAAGIVAFRTWGGQLPAIVGQVFGTIGATINTTLAPIGAQIVSFFTPSIAGVEGVVGKIGAWIATVPVTVGTFMASIPGTIVGAFQRAVGDVPGVLAALPGIVQSAVSGAGSWLVGAGESIIQGFLHGLKIEFENVKDFIGSIGQWIADHKGPKAYDLRLLVPAGGWIMKGLASGLTGGIPDVRRALQGVSAEIGAGVRVPSVPGGYGSMGSSLTNQVFVQNPWTGEYLQARVAEVADSRIASYDDASDMVTVGGRR